MRFVRFVFFIILLAVGAVAFMATRRAIHAQPPRGTTFDSNDVVEKKAADAPDSIATDEEPSPRKREGQAVSTAEPDLAWDNGGSSSNKGQVLDTATENTATAGPEPDTEDWNAVVKVVLVYHQDSARKAIEGVMFAAGRDTLVVTAANAGIAPKGIAPAIDRVLVERFDEGQGSSLIQPAEYVKADVPDLIIYRLPGTLTQLRLANKVNPKSLTKIAFRDLLVAQNVDFAGPQPPSRRSTSVSVTNLGASVQVPIGGKTRTYPRLIQLSGTLRDGTPVFKAGRLVGITLLGSGQIQAASYMLPIELLRERCRRAYIQDTTERAIERDDEATADPEVATNDAISEPIRSDLSPVSKVPLIAAEQGQDAIPAHNTDSNDSPPPLKHQAIPTITDEQPVGDDTETLPPNPSKSRNAAATVDAGPEDPKPDAPQIDPPSVEDDYASIPKASDANISETFDPPKLKKPQLDETPQLAEETQPAAGKLDPRNPALADPSTIHPPIPNSAIPPIVRAVIHVSHLEPEDTAKTLRSLFADSADGHGIVRIASNTSSRTIIISAPQDSIVEIQKTVAELEDQAAQVAREALKKREEDARSSGNDREWLERYRNGQAAATNSQAAEAAMGGTSLHQIQDKQDVALDQESKELSAQVRGVQGPERDKLRSKLEELATRHFELRQQLRLKEIDALAQRVEQLRAAHGKRNEQKSQIIKRRIAELLGEDGDLDWDASQRRPVNGNPLQSGKDAAVSEPKVVSQLKDIQSEMKLGKGITELIQLPNRIKTVDEFDEKLVKVSPVQGQACEVRVTGLAEGRTRIVLKDEHDKRYVIDLLVRDYGIPPAQDIEKASPKPKIPIPNEKGAESSTDSPVTNSN